MSTDNPLQPVAAKWTEKIRQALEFKKRKFQDDADDCMAFFNGPYDWLYGINKNTTGAGKAFTLTSDDGEMPRPKFCMTVNKVAEMVQLFGPVLYHRNPVRQVNPRKFPDVPPELVFPAMMMAPPTDPAMGGGMGGMPGGMPGAMPGPMDVGGGMAPQGMMDPAQMQAMMQAQQAQMQAQQALAQQDYGKQIDAARAVLLEAYLNYTPTALNLKEHCRAAIDEALIKGMGVLWTEVYQPPGSDTKLIGSFYDSVDNLVIDPDMESIEAATWIARRCTHPVWQVERDYNLPPGSLKGNLESYDRQADVATSTDGDYNRRRGITNDLLVYWKIWSKMGIGGRLTGIAPDLAPVLDQLGDNCYLVVCDKVPYPLNLPPEVQQAGDMEDINTRVQWPTPFWADDAWPFTPIVFHKVPREVWPISHLKPGMGELKFINWVFSFMAGKIRTACRDFIGIPKGTAEEMKTQILNGQDFSLIEIDALNGRRLEEVVSFLQHPPFHKDIYEVLQHVMDLFEKRVGLTELMYGSSPVQLRSASEAQLKGDQLRVRPDDMANKVEDSMTLVARLEALAARWHLSGQDVQPMLGAYAAQAWQQIVAPSDPKEILHQLEYRIEAGSAKKPNKDRDIANANSMMQTLFPFLQQYALTTGDVSQVNALIGIWAKAMDADATALTIQPPPMPPPMPPGGEPPPEGAAA